MSLFVVKLLRCSLPIGAANFISYRFIYIPLKSSKTSMRCSVLGRGLTKLMLEFLLLVILTELMRGFRRIGRDGLPSCKFLTFVLLSAPIDIQEVHRRWIGVLCLKTGLALQDGFRLVKTIEPRGAQGGPEEQLLETVQTICHFGRQ